MDDAVDEIDTNNMAIYNAEVASNIKREDVTQDLSNSGHKRTHQQAFDIMGTETSADKRQAFNDPSSSSSGNDGKKLLSEMTTGPVAGQSLLLNNSSERGKTAVDLELSSDNFISAQTLPSGSGILNSPSTSREINSIEKQLYGKDNYDLTNEMPNELFNSQV